MSLRIAAIPTTLAMVEKLTTPYRARHPNVQFTIYSRNSLEILDLLENLEIDAGITYVENEPLGRVGTVPLYHERYRLLTSSDAPLGNRDSVTWAEVAQVPLCLLTPDMQNRRIIDRLLKSAGGESRPTLESDSMILLFSHVRTGRWASVMPEKLADTLGLTERLRSIPIVEPEVVHQIGLVVPPREPMAPLASALVAEASMRALSLEYVDICPWALREGIILRRLDSEADGTALVETSVGDAGSKDSGRSSGGRSRGTR